MAVNDTSKLNILFKKIFGKSATSDANEFFEESINARQAVYSNQVWNQFDDIPSTAPGGADQEVTGVVKRWIDLVLTAVPGAPNAFYSANLKDAIPFNFGDGSYNYEVKDSGAAAIPFGQGDWVVDTDTGTLWFTGTLPSNMPPSISFYQYVGTKGVGSGSGGGSGSGLRNYFVNGSFEENIDDVTAYNDAGAYVDGTGGTEDITFAYTDVSPITGVGSLVLEKPASNCQGQGLSFDVEFDDIDDNSNNCYVYINFDTSDANYDEDLELKFYDIDNTAIIVPDAVWNLTAINNPTFIPNGGLVKMLALLPNLTTKNLRVSVNIATTSTDAWDVKIDDLLITTDIKFIFKRLVVGNITMEGGVISTNTVNGDLSLQPNGFGKVRTLTELESKDIVSGGTIRDLTSYGIRGQNASFITSSLGIGDWTRYKDAGASPTDGTGGTPDAEFDSSRDAINDPALLGGVSLNLSTDNLFNCQGNGVSLDASISIANRGRPNYFSFYQRGLADDYVDGDMAVFVYDVTNSVLLTVLNDNEIPKADGYNKYYFIPASNTATVRVIIHVTTATTALRSKLFTDFKLRGEDNFANVPSDIYQDINLTGSGNFTGGSIRVSKIGKNVSITQIVAATFSSASSVSSAAGIIPIWARPSIDITNTSRDTSAAVSQITISSAGTLTIDFRDWGGSTTNATGVSTLSINYNVSTSNGSVSALIDNGNLEILTATSSVKTPGASQNYMAMTGNSLVLKAGLTYDLVGQVLFSFSGGSPAYSGLLAGWFGANGADSGTVPTLLTAVSTIQVLSNTNVFRELGPARTDVQTNDFSLPNITVRALSDTTIYLVPWANMTTASNARVTAYLTAKEIPFSNTALMSGYIYLGTETWADSEANATTSVALFRSGKLLKVMGIITVTGAFSGGSFGITIPTAYLIDLDFYQGSPASTRQTVGLANLYDATGSIYQGTVDLRSTSEVRITVANSSSTFTFKQNVTNNDPFTWASGDSIGFTAEWVVDGW